MNKRIKFSQTFAPQATEVDFDTSLLRLIFNTQVTKAQQNVGIVGKVTILHPAFSTRATLYETATGAIRVQPSSKPLGINKGFFNIVTLNVNVRKYIVDEFRKIGTGEVTPWYNSLEGRTTYVDDKDTNEVLDIKEMIISTQLSEAQANAGIIAKVNLVTSVGMVNAYTVFASLYNNQLYGREQTEDENNEIAGYKLTAEAEAQVLRHLHSQIDEWVVVGPATIAKKRPAQAIQEAIEEAVANINEAELFAQL